MYDDYEDEPSSGLSAGSKAVLIAVVMFFAGMAMMLAISAASAPEEPVQTAVSQPQRPGELKEVTLFDNRVLTVFGLAFAVSLVVRFVMLLMVLSVPLALIFAALKISKAIIEKDKY